MLANVARVEGCSAERCRLGQCCRGESKAGNTAQRHGEDDNHTGQESFRKGSGSQAVRSV